MTWVPGSFQHCQTPLLFSQNPVCSTLVCIALVINFRDNIFSITPGNMTHNQRDPFPFPPLSSFPALSPFYGPENTFHTECRISVAMTSTVLALRTPRRLPKAARNFQGSLGPSSKYAYTSKRRQMPVLADGVSFLSLL